jgi:hypothetical protein
MTFTVEFEREDDGRWLAEVLETSRRARLWASLR